VGRYNSSYSTLLFHSHYTLPSRLLSYANWQSLSKLSSAGELQKCELWDGIQCG